MEHLLQFKQTGLMLQRNCFPSLDVHVKQAAQHLRCSCKKYGLECTAGCKLCKGVSCENSQKPQDEEDEYK